MARRAIVLAALCLPFAVAAASGELDCLVEPSMVIDASTAVEGILESVEVDKGDLVTRGQVIARLVSDVEAATVEHARARVQGTAALASRRVRLDFSRIRLERARELQRNQFAAANEIDELRAEVELAELALVEERERARLAELELHRAEALYRTRIVHSPIDGVVVDRFLAPGEFAQAKPIARIARTDPLRVEVVMPVALFGRIPVGTTARVRLASPVGGEHAARVSVVDRLIDGASATFLVRLELPNPDHALPAGIDCTVHFPHLDGG